MSKVERIWKEFNHDFYRMAEEIFEQEKHE